MNTENLKYRLTERLNVTGLEAAKASRLAGLSVDAIRNILNGKSKNPGVFTLEKLAEVLDCSVAYLIGEDYDGETRIDDPLIDDALQDEAAAGARAARRMLPIVGYIGAGAEFYGIDDHEKGGGLDMVDAPPGCSPSAVAVQVRGESMLPVYSDGDILVYSQKRTDVMEFLNRRCVCGLADGRILVKTPIRGSAEGLFTLTSFNAPPITDIILEWAARIEWVQPR